MATLSPHIDQLPRIQVESRWDIEFLKTNLHNALIRSILEQTGCSSETDDKVKQMEHKMNKVRKADLKIYIYMYFLFSFK